MTDPHPKPIVRRRDRHEKIMDARIRFSRGFREHNEIREAVDYLFSEVNLLLHQVEELKEQLKGKS